LRVLESDMKRGAVEVEVEDNDDLWHLYNIIDTGDTVCGMTMREVKVSHGGEEERGGRRRIYACITVEDLGFQTFTERLRIKGKVTVGPEDMNIQGSYHSFSVGVRDRITIVKREWLSFHRERIERAASKAKPRVLVITIDDQEAVLSMISDYQIEELMRVSSNMPGKYVDNVDRPTIRSKYFAAISEEVGRIVQKGVSDIILAGPGFTKSDLARHLRDKFKSARIVEETASCIGEPGVREVMNRGALTKLIEGSAIMRDSKLIDELLSRLARSPSLVSYGANEVKTAVDRGAVESLLVSEKLLKSITPEERRGIEGLCKSVEKYGGKVFFIGSEHEKGRQLSGIGGIAALLRFPVN